MINRYRPGTDTSAETVRALTERAFNPPIPIGLRTDYEKADAAGLTAPEINREAAKEIANVWNAVRRTANNGQG